MKASNLALRPDDEPIVLAAEPRLVRAVIAAEANESPFRRPQLSLRFKNRHLGGRTSEISDQALRLFRVR